MVESSSCKSVFLGGTSYSHAQALFAVGVTDVVSVSTSRSRDVPTSRLGLVSTKARRLGLVSASDLCVSDLVSVSTQNVSGLVAGLGPFRLVETFHAGAPNLTTILHFAQLSAIQFGL